VIGAGPHYLARERARQLAVAHDRDAVHNGGAHAASPRLEPADATGQVVEIFRAAPVAAMAEILMGVAFR